MLILPRVSPWGWPEGLVHNLQIPQQVFNKIQDFHVQDTFSSVGVLQPYFKSSEGIGCTSLHCGVLTRFAIKIVFLQFAQREKTKKSLLTSYVRGQLLTCPQPRILFFGSRVAGFASDPSCLKNWLLCPFFYKEATCKGSTGKGLLYAAKAAPAKDYFMHLTLIIARKGRWVISPDYRTSHPRRFCAVGDVVAQRYDILRDWLWDACHMAGVRWGYHCEAFVVRRARTIAMSEAQGSCHKTSNNQP